MRDLSAEIAFVRENTQALAPPHVPELTLHLATEMVPIWQLTEEELARQGLPPPFWAFAWAGGQALSRYILDNPDIVRGRRVLDFAAGAGLAGIAAMKAGAGSVLANDVDAFSCAACLVNAEANGTAMDVTDQDLVGTPNPPGAEHWDVILAGDICYEQPLAARVEAWLKGLAQGGAQVFVGDPGRAYLPRQGLTALATYEVKTTRELEDQEVRRTSVWRLSPSPDAR